MADWLTSIREKTTQIKDGSGNSVLRDIALVLVLVLIGLSSFALGRLSASEQMRPAVQIGAAQVYSEQPMNIGGMVVASRQGSRYHYPWCPGAQAMNDSNKVWFDSIEQARAAGYTPASNCRGLE